MAFCDTCDGSLRRLWSGARNPQIPIVETAGYMSLARCPECGRLWVSVAEGPGFSVIFVAAWPATVEAWRRLVLVDEGRPVYEWHAAVAREDWHSLPGVEQHFVDEYRWRTYRRYNAIDRGPGVPAPRYCRTSADLYRLLEPGERAPD